MVSTYYLPVIAVPDADLRHAAPPIALISMALGQGAAHLNRHNCFLQKAGMHQHRKMFMYATPAGFTFGIARRSYCGFSLSVAILLVLLTVSCNNFAKLTQVNTWNTHTYTVLTGDQDMMQSLVNLESGERGFALTGTDTSLEPYIAAKAAFQQSLNSVMALMDRRRATLGKLAQADQVLLAERSSVAEARCKRRLHATALA